MRTIRASALILLALAGCDEGAPPLDDLPLRDALRADPAVVATMSDDARQRLATRLDAARAGDDASDPIAGDPATTAPDVLVGEADAARAQRSGDALIVGAIASGVARALRGDAQMSETPPLPPLEVDATAAPIAALESRALQGRAGGLLRAVFSASGAHHLRRVVGWPTGAVAIDDTVYVGAGWLAALAPATHADGGADAGALPGPTPTTAAAIGAASASAGTPASASDGHDPPDGGALRATPPVDNVGAPYPGYADGGGVVVYPPSTPQPPPTSTTEDSCGAAAGSCAACDASSDDGDSCDGGTDDSSDDSCNSTDDGSDNSCNTAGDGSDDTNCQVSRRGRQHGGTSPRMMLSLFAPLAFLFSRRRR